MGLGGDTERTVPRCQGMDKQVLSPDSVVQIHLEDLQPRRHYWTSVAGLPTRSSTSIGPRPPVSFTKGALAPLLLLLGEGAEALGPQRYPP